MRHARGRGKTAAQSGRRIRVKFAVVPAKLRADEPDPIVVFAGGPGQGAIALAPQVMPLFARLNDTRDILFVDQRGTGGSNPLDCNGEHAAAGRCSRTRSRPRWSPSA